MKKLIALIALPVMLFLSGCDSDDNKTVVDIIIGRDDLSTLATAVTTAGLADTLDGEGPFTVFAPNNGAFAALPAGTVEALLADVDALTNILLYHVVGADLKAADVVVADSLQSLQGTGLDIKVNDDGVFIENAQIIVTDLDAENGTVHIINAVLIP